MRRPGSRGAALAALTLIATASAAQQPARTGDEHVVKLSVTLVQVDAIVTDKEGRPVTDLKKEDFEVLQDERPQEISTFLYVSTPPPPIETVAATDSGTNGHGSDAVVSPASARRTIAVVIDDLKSNESARSAREALRAFVDQHMERGDAIAIVQARAGAGALQQFSSDKQRLYAAIDRVRYVPRSRVDLECEDVAKQEKHVEGEGDLDEALRTDIFVRGTLGVLNFVVRGLKELPGRKSVVLLSDGMPCTFADVDPKGRGDTRVRAAMLALVDLANRSSVAIYTIDVRGLEALTPIAQERAAAPRLNNIVDLFGARRSSQFRSRDLLSFLAQQTGGLFIFNTNDIAAGLRRAVEDQRGYYLVAYVPDETTFAPHAGKRDFHELTVKVKRPNLTVRSRTGFYGYPDEEPQPETRSRAQQMVDAVISPFAASGIRVALTPLVADDSKLGPVVRCLLHVDTRDLTFATLRDGSREGVVDLAVVAFGDNGGMVSRQARTQTLRLSPELYEQTLTTGIEEIVTLPVREPGAYQVRAAVRDAASARLGSAYQFVAMPDVRGGELAVSGIVLTREAATVAPPGLAMKRAASGALPSSIALRRFQRGDQISYGFEIYNAAKDRAKRAPQLALTTRVYLNGKLVDAFETRVLEVTGQADLARLRFGRGLQIGSEMESGAYVLELEVSETSTGKRRVATQWTDFEIE